MKRCELKEADTWDLTKFFKNEKEYNNKIEETLKYLEEIKTFQGAIASSATNFAKFLKLDEAINLNLEQIYIYSYLYHYSDTTSEVGKTYKEKAEKLAEKVSTETSFIRSELLSYDYDYIKSLIKENKALEKYAFSLEQTFRYKAHTLSKEEEKVITLASNAFGTPDEAFSSLDNADAKFDTVMVDGVRTKITHSNYLKLMNHKDRNVRKQVFKKYYEYFINHKNTIADLYKGQVKQDFFFSKVRKFKNPLEQSLYADNICPEVYYNLIDTIHNNLDVMYNYMDLRKEFLGISKLHMYDMYVDLVPNESHKFTFEEAKEIIMNALKPLGDSYLNDLDKAFKERWIDKYPCDGKRSGAYEWGAYGIDPYVSINFEGTEDSVSTLAHELGHAMHSYYSNKNQTYIDAGYPIFLAEIASTVNEVLLNEYMINNAKTDEEKLLYITSFLDKFRTTVYRQTMFAEFEMLIHAKEEQEEIITTDTLKDTYYELNKLYYGKNVVSDKEIAYEWSRIPHFYTPFYVYKYATGFCAALAIVSNILSGRKDALDNYLTFLSSGGSKYPLDTLKICGVDMTSNEPINKAILMFKKRLEMAQNIIKKVKN